LADQTKPEQLIGLTLPQTKPSEKVTITYKVSEEIQSQKSAIKAIPPENRVSDPFRENDPRLIVYEPKRPLLSSLPEQGENATKKWIISQLTDAMMPNENKSSHMKKNNPAYPCQTNAAASAAAPPATIPQ